MVGAIFYRRLPPPAHPIVWLLGFWFIAETTAQVLARQHINNWYIYSALSLVEIFALVRFYRLIYIQAKARKIATWFGWVGICVAFVEFGITKKPDNSVTTFFECLLFFAMGLYALYESILNQADRRFNFIVICIMVLFLGSSVYFSTWKYMRYDEFLFKLFGSAHAYLLIVCYLSLTYALWRLQLRY